MCLARWPTLTRLAIPEASLVCKGDKKPLHTMPPPRPEEMQIQYPPGSGSASGDRASEMAAHISRLQRLAENKSVVRAALKRVGGWFQGQD